MKITVISPEGIGTGELEGNDIRVAPPSYWTRAEQIRDREELAADDISVFEVSPDRMRRHLDTVNGLQSAMCNLLDHPMDRFARENCHELLAALGRKP